MITRSPLHQPGRRRRALPTQKAAEEKGPLASRFKAHPTFFFVSTCCCCLELHSKFKLGGRPRNVSQVPRVQSAKAPPPLSETEAFFYSWSPRSGSSASRCPLHQHSGLLSLHSPTPQGVARPRVSPAATMNGGGERRRYSSEQLLFDVPANVGAGRWAPQQVRPNGSRSAWSPGFPVSTGLSSSEGPLCVYSAAGCGAGMGRSSCR